VKSLKTRFFKLKAVLSPKNSPKFWENEKQSKKTWKVSFQVNFHESNVNILYLRLKYWNVFSNCENLLQLQILSFWCHFLLVSESLFGVQVNFQGWNVWICSQKFWWLTIKTVFKPLKSIFTVSKSIVKAKVFQLVWKLWKLFTKTILNISEVVRVEAGFFKFKFPEKFYNYSI